MYMLHEVNKVLDENRPTWEGESRMVNLYDQYRMLKEKLENFFIQKDELETPYQEVRDKLLDQFATKIVQLAGFLHDLSIEKGSESMTIYTDLTKASLVNASIQDCLTKSKAVLDYAETMEADLGSFSNGVALYTEAAEQYQSFRDNGLLPFDRRNRLRELNKDIKALISEIREFLGGRLDRVVLFFTDSAPRFYAKYIESRIVPKINATRGSSSSAEEEQDGDIPEDDTDSNLDNMDEESNSSPPVSLPDEESEESEESVDNTDTDSADDSDGSEEADY